MLDITNFIYKDPITEEALDNYELEAIHNPDGLGMSINWLGNFYFIDPNNIPIIIKEFNIADYTYDILDLDNKIFTGMGLESQEMLFKDLKRSHFLKSFQDLKKFELILSSIRVKLYKGLLCIKCDTRILLRAVVVDNNINEYEYYNIFLIDDSVKDRLEGYNCEDLTIQQYNIIIFAVWLDNTLGHNTKSARN